jgi:hypothetical protein
MAIIDAAIDDFVEGAALRSRQSSSNSESISGLNL